MKRIYLDNAASTPMLPLTVEAYMNALKEDIGNPSAIHRYGRTNRSKIETARSKVAKCLHCSIGEIFFTSGGTESNNTALRTAVRDLGVKRIISSPIEHPSIANTLAYLAENRDVEVVFLDIDPDGNPDIDQLENLLRASQTPTLVSIMHANNELGTMIDLKKVSTLCKEHGAYMHSDTVQTVGHLPLDLDDLDLTFLSASAHKFHGPKGVGILYSNNNNPVGSLLKGGSQERNMRAGTENVAGIAATGDILEYMVANIDKHKEEILELRTYFKDQIIRDIPEAEFNGNQSDNFLFTILSVAFPSNNKTDMIVPLLDIEGIAASGGSACSSGAQQESRVIKAIKPNTEKKTVRFSLSHLNTKEEIDHVMDKLRSFFS